MLATKRNLSLIILLVMSLVTVVSCNEKRNKRERIGRAPKDPNKVTTPDTDTTQAPKIDPATGQPIEDEGGEQSGGDTDQIKAIADQEAELSSGQELTNIKEIPAGNYELREVRSFIRTVSETSEYRASLEQTIDINGAEANLPAATPVKAGKLEAKDQDPGIGLSIPVNFVAGDDDAKFSDEQDRSRNAFFLNTITEAGTSMELKEKDKLPNMVASVIDMLTKGNLSDNGVDLHFFQVDQNTVRLLIVHSVTQSGYTITRDIYLDYHLK